MWSIIKDIMSSPEVGAGLSITLSLTLVIISILWKKINKLQKEIYLIYEERIKELKESNKELGEVVGKAHETVETIKKIVSVRNGHETRN